MYIAFKDIKTFYKQLTVNYLLNPENWTQPKVNTERSQMNNSMRKLDVIIAAYKTLSACLPRSFSYLVLCFNIVITFGCRCMISRVNVLR